MKAIIFAAGLYVVYRLLKAAQPPSWPADEEARDALKLAEENAALARTIADKVD